MPPAEVGDAAARIDAAMIQAVEAVSYVGMCGDGYARRRVHLPARMRGCGIRSLATLAPIAYGARRRWRLSAGGRGGAAARLRAASP